MTSILIIRNKREEILYSHYRDILDASELKIVLLLLLFCDQAIGCSCQ